MTVASDEGYPLPDLDNVPDDPEAIIADTEIQVIEGERLEFKPQPPPYEGP